MRLIDADKLEQIIEENIKDYEETNDPIRCDANKIHLSTVRGMPTIDAKPVKHGYWIKTPSPYHVKCSSCKTMICIKFHGVEVEKFCRNCGAKMNGESE